MKKFFKIVLAISAVAVGFYPILYFLIDRKFGLLGTKSAGLLNQIIWNGMFYSHIIFGGIALLIGWLQFNKKIQQNQIGLHRTIGKIYLIMVCLSGISSLYIGYHATGGWIAQLGFLSLGILWLYTSTRGWFAVKKGNIVLHQKMMIYSYAACFAAVTLRIWLPLLSFTLGGFLPAYKIVAWLAWVPNLIVAHLIIKKKFTSIHSTQFN